MSSDTILAMFSGGIDSAGVLHKLFTDPEWSAAPLVIHHIYLQNRENRAAAESQAIEKIIRYYSSKFPERQFTYTDSIFNTTGFAPLKSHRFPFDVDVCSFIAGNICVSRKDIRRVAFGRQRSDMQSRGESLKKRMQRAQSVFRSLYMFEKEDLPEYVFPVLEMTKQEIWESLPKEVQAATWYCRHPKYQKNGQATPCQKCTTCKQVAEFLEPT